MYVTQCDDSNIVPAIVLYETRATHVIDNITPDIDMYGTIVTYVTTISFQPFPECRPQ